MKQTKYLGSCVGYSAGDLDVESGRYLEYIASKNLACRKRRILKPIHFDVDFLILFRVHSVGAMLGLLER